MENMRILTTTNDANLRKAVRRRGYILEKHRHSKYYEPMFQDGYRILNDKRLPVAGNHYELKPEDIRDFLNEH